MSVVFVNRIYEDNRILRSAIDRVISSLKLGKRDIIFINILYHGEWKSNKLYPGMKYIMTLRGEQKDNSRVLFYGFESLDSLRKKPEASILKSPAVDYIKMPFDLSQLKNTLNKLRPAQEKNGTLDEKTEKLFIEDKDKEFKLQVRGFVHDWRNGVTYLTALLNDLQGHQKDFEAFRQNINKLKKYKEDFIGQKNESYKEIRKAVEQRYKRCKKITTLPDLLRKAERSYKTMYNSLDKASTNNIKVMAVIDALQKTIGNLKEVEDLLDECTKR